MNERCLTLALSLHRVHSGILRLGGEGLDCHRIKAPRPIPQSRHNLPPYSTPAQNAIPKYSKASSTSEQFSPTHREFHQNGAELFDALQESGLRVLTPTQIAIPKNSMQAWPHKFPPKWSWSSWWCTIRKLLTMQMGSGSLLKIDGSRCAQTILPGFSFLHSFSSRKPKISSILPQWRRSNNPLLNPKPKTLKLPKLERSEQGRMQSRCTNITPLHKIAFRGNDSTYKHSPKTQKRLQDSSSS